MTTPEAEAPTAPIAESVLVKEVPETPETPKEIEDTGVRDIPSQFTQIVTDDQGQQMMQSPATQQVTVKIPASKEDLEVWAKGPDDNALTWLAKFWLRMWQKAAYYGWKVVTTPFQTSPEANK